VGKKLEKYIITGSICILGVCIFRDLYKEIMFSNKLRRY